MGKSRIYARFYVRISCKTLKKKWKPALWPTTLKRVRDKSQRVTDISVEALCNKIQMERNDSGRTSPRGNTHRNVKRDLFIV